MLLFSRIDRSIRATGLIPRGGFHPRPDDGVPSLPGGEPAATVILAGNAGPSMWKEFEPELARSAEPDPLDRWSVRVVGGLAAELGGHPLFPFGPPYLPFQRWAVRADVVFPSPLGMLVHPDYGLWHAYRGAIAFSAYIRLPPRPRREHPCESCRGRPCLHTCPVDAFRPGAYDTDKCISHIGGAAGGDCMDCGCRARRACPVGQAYRHAPVQARFHMRAFYESHARAPGAGSGRRGEISS